VKKGADLPTGKKTSSEKSSEKGRIFASTLLRKREKEKGIFFNLLKKLSA